MKIVKTQRHDKDNQKNKTESYWHNEELYDAKREKEFKVKFLGITIYYTK